ncbi:MAG: M15 family metallopeptidase [Ilumatobacter sp.]|nr:M15 family metallopeptidase [Ilumatobacter sp.]
MRRSTIVTAVAVAALSAVPVLAVGGGTVTGPAVGNERSERLPYEGDAVRVYNVGELRDDVAANALAAARLAGGTGAITRSASIGMARVRRGSSIVQQAASGWAYPMGTTVLPVEAVGPLMGFDVSAALSAGTLVMGRRSADLRGARAGDTIDLISSGGSAMTFSISAVVDDDRIGGTELLLSDEGADRLGIARLSSVLIWGFDSRAAIDAALATHGLVTTSLRIRRTWGPADPDSTMGMSRTKAALGEFQYFIFSSGAVTTDDVWRSTYISKAGPIGRLTLRSGCHVVVRAALQEAINEVVEAGLENTIDYADANRYGGCYVPRFSRLAPNSSIGFLSRHTWGMAVDTNTQGSCQGCAPPDMDCRTVRIFRKHGFAWGGNYLVPDGMHFEWVGERRDQILGYPSRFCPNVVGGALRAADPPQNQRSTMFADDGLAAEG